MSASMKSVRVPGLRRLGMIGVLGAGLALSGCVVAPLGPAYVADDGVVVNAPYAPPPLQTEVIPVAPSPVSVWIGGYWGWGGGNYHWVPGRWERPPHAGWGWQPHRWQQGPRGGWQMRGGHWGPGRR
jgi:hypothetical protein